MPCGADCEGRVSRLLRDMDRVVRYAEQWGVPIRFADPPKSIVGNVAENVSRGPLHGFIECDGTRRTIWWPMPGDLSGHGYALPMALLHELSHCVDGSPPDKADEVNGPMLAFELISARRLRIRGWHAWMRNFQIEDLDESQTAEWRVTWSDASRIERTRILRQSLSDAVCLNLLTTWGEPTFQRRKVAA